MPLERFTGLPQSAFFEFSNNRVDYFRTFGRVECHSFVNFKSFFDDCRKKSWSLKIFVKFQRPHNYGEGVPCRLFHFFQLTATGFQDLTVLTLVFHSVRKTFAAFVHLQQTPYQVQLSSSPQLRVYYSLAVWGFKPILSAGLRYHSHLSGGLRLRNYRAVAGNHKLGSRFSVFACFCGAYSNRDKWLGRLSGNFILVKAILFDKGLPFRARPSQSGLPSASKPFCSLVIEWGYRNNLFCS